MIAGDTIAAVSSSVGSAARMIVRLSGPDSRGIVAKLEHGGSGVPPLGFPNQSRDGSATLTKTGARRTSLHFRRRALPAWLYVFVAPRSYTGEDLVEIHLPGNPLLARLFLQDLIRAGARQAEAGEFTALAYFNGRMDLTEAEGVAATIAAHGEDELHAARRLLAGELSRRLAGTIDELSQVLALVEVGIDFSDEDVRFLSADEIRRRVDAAADLLRRLVAESSRFERLSHEVEFVLVGRPNAGKSTLLNALCGQERAVVSPVAGTTRDVLSAEVVLPRGMVRITDAAGLADDAAAAGPIGEIAAMMRQQSLKALERADRVVLVREVTDTAPALDLPQSPDLVVHTKADMAIAPDGLNHLSGNFLEIPNRHPERTREGSGREIRSQMFREYAQHDDCRDVRRLSYPPEHGHACTDQMLVSALTGQGMSELRSRLDAMAFGRSSGSALALNARHLSAIDEAMASLDRAAGLSGGDQAETLAFELRAALDALGRIVGQVSPDDVLARVFSAFCIGK